MSTTDILHIAQDEKFIPAARFLFEKAFPGKNRFVIIKPAGNPPLKYIKDDFPAEFLVHSPSTVVELTAMAQQARVVILHGLDKMKAAVYQQLSDKGKIAASIFGAEMYNAHISGTDYLGDKTRMLEKTIRRQTLVDWLKGLYRRGRYRHTKGLYRDVDMKSIIYDISHFCLISRNTHQQFIKRGILNPRSRMIPFSYYPLDFIITDNTLRAGRSDILLGNSASATNNHLEAFDILKSLDLGNRKVVTPLSYGKPKYARMIERYGHKLLPRHFEALRDFIPLADYNKLLSSCGFVVMNHYRSQAMGNLITSLYIGAKVFLNDTEAYQYFKKLGCNIYLIDKDLVGEGKAGLTPLTQEQVDHNRQILEKELSSEILAVKLRKAVTHIYGGNVSIG